MPVTGIEHQSDPIDAVDGLGSELRRVDGGVSKAEKLEGDPDAHDGSAVARNLQRIAGTRHGAACCQARRSRCDREKVWGTDLPADAEARLEVGFDQLAVHPAVGPQAQGHAVESQHLVGTDDRGRGADLRGVPQEALGARLDSRITGFAGDRHHVLGGRRHQRGPVEIDGRGHFSRITPNVKPATMYLRPITISTSGSAIAITPEAAISFQMISN